MADVDDRHGSARTVAIRRLPTMSLTRCLLPAVQKPHMPCPQLPSQPFAYRDKIASIAPATFPSTEAVWKPIGTVTGCNSGRLWQRGAAKPRRAAFTAQLAAGSPRPRPRRRWSLRVKVFDVRTRSKHLDAVDEFLIA